MTQPTAENDAAALTLTDAERMKISAVVHQNYYMPDVFEAVQQIIHLRAFYAWEAGFAGGITAEHGGRIQNPWRVVDRSLMAVSPCPVLVTRRLRS